MAVSCEPWGETKISILVQKQKYARRAIQNIKKGIKKDLKDFRANVQKQEKVVKVRNAKLQKRIQKKIQGKGQKKKFLFLSKICKERHYCNDKVERLRNSENATELEEATNIVEGLMMTIPAGIPGIHETLDTVRYCRYHLGKFIVHQ